MKKEHFDKDGNLTSTETQTFTDSNCSSIIEGTIHNSSSVIFTTETTRDGKHFFGKNNPATSSLRTLSTGNITQKIVANSGITDAYSSYNSTFEYNDADYPTKEIRTYLNGTVKEYTYEYYE